MRVLVGENSDLSESLKRMAQTVAGAITTDNSSAAEGVLPDFQSAISQALKDLSATSENLQVTTAMLLYKL